MTYELTIQKKADIKPVNISVLKISGKINELLTALHSTNILYCHWKSNYNLEASMQCDTDLDVLFDYSQKTDLIKLLDKLDFKKCNAIAVKRFKDIEDYIGFDSEFGKIIHLHAHFKLTLGEPYLKGYQWNIEQLILDNRIFDEEFKVYRSHPTHELILLFVRMALKLRLRHKIKIALGKDSSISKNVYREFKWLKSQVTAEQIEQGCLTLFEKPWHISKIIAGDLTYESLKTLSNSIHQEFRKYRVFNLLNGRIIRWSRELKIKYNSYLAKHTSLPVLQKRSSGGIIVALVGADGSGKSTVFENLKQTFSKKLDVYPIYFGSGNFRSISKRFHNGMKSIRTTATSHEVNTKFKKDETTLNIKSKSSLFKMMRETLNALEIALIKKRQLNRMIKAKKKGMIVICDRFPQNQFHGFNDGPRLNHLLSSKNVFLRSAAKKEAAIYKQTEVIGPDLVFKLIADASIVAARKPGQTSIQTLEKKIEAIKRVQFPMQTTVIEINASDPLEIVLRMVKTGIWSYILNQPKANDN